MSIRRTQFATQARTWIILAGLAALFIGLGGLVGGRSGIILFAGIAIVFNLVMFWFSDRLALKASKAVPAEQSEQPELFRDIEEIAGRAGVPMPRVYLIPSDQPNAFSTGRGPKKAVVADPEGLLRHLPREQVRGVLAHEIGYRQPRHPRDDDRSDDPPRSRRSQQVPILAALGGGDDEVRGRSG